MTARIRSSEATGLKFNRLTIESLSHRNKNYTPYFLCRCDCGGSTITTLIKLRRSITVSCGCYRDERIGALNRRHSKSGTKVYYTWQKMRARCSNPNDPSYFNYGGRGIKVCERWESFDNFLADMGEPPNNNHSIDRIDNNGSYEPGNCRWANRVMQVRNRRVTKVVTYRGESRPLAEWCEILGVNYDLSKQRLLNGWDSEKAFTQPSRGNWIGRKKFRT